MTSNKIIEEDLSEIINSSVNWKRFSGKTILVSGANGFLPAYMIETLLFLSINNTISDIKIICLVRNREKAMHRFRDYLPLKCLKFMVQDVCDPIKTKAKIDIIIHAASQASPRYYEIDPVGTLSANTLGTANLLKLAQLKNIELFLYFSSSEVYGEVNTNVAMIKETDFGFLDPTCVRSCYAESKRMGETMCISWMHQYQIPVKIVRPFHTYGPGMDLNDGRVYADFISNIVSNEDIVMKSDGLAKRAFCYLTDATIAFFKIIDKGIDGEAYNVGNPNCEVSIINLAKILINIFPSKKLTVIHQQNDKKNYLHSKINRNSPDITKLMSLGWKPKTSIEDGFNRTILSYQNCKK